MTPYAEVIGDPISHSKSPVIHQFWLDALAIAGSYRATHVKADTLASYIADRRDDSDWRGCNVTVPHKINVMDVVDDSGDIRGTIGAMNTILRDPSGHLVGTNTDAAGFFAPIAELPLLDESVVMVGTGGVAHAVLFALSRAAVGSVTILARDPAKASALLKRFGLDGNVQAIDAPLPSAKLLINASVLGMVGQLPLTLDLSPLPAHAIIYDLVYAPLQTELLLAAMARDLVIVDGLEMLIGQAALAFELFFGAPPPRDRDAELRALLTS